MATYLQWDWKQNNVTLMLVLKIYNHWLSLLLTSERQSLHVTSYQKHHFPYSHTGSCCCHGDWGQLRLYASDCLSSALKADSWFGGIHVCRYTAISAVRTGSCCCETSLWNLESLRPFIIAAAETIKPLFFIRCSYCSSGEDLCGHSSWSLFFFKVAACGALHMIQRSAFFLRWRVNNLNICYRVFMNDIPPPAFIWSNCGLLKRLRFFAMKKHFSFYPGAILFCPFKLEGRFHGFVYLDVAWLEDVKNENYKQKKHITCFLEVKTHLQSPVQKEKKYLAILFASMLAC